MDCSRRFSPMLVAVLVVIGCGSSKPQDASATTEETQTPKPIVLAQAAHESAPQNGGTSITGTVKFSGTVPEAKKIKMSADPVCLQQHTEAFFSEKFVVGDDGSLKNVFVYVKEGVTGDYAPPSEPVILNQLGCWYHPRVFGIQVNQNLEILNSDATLHNVNAKPKSNRSFNIAQPIKGMKTKKKFTKPEIGVPLKCNVHPWMNAYVNVVAHPFFSVTGEDGTFSISGLPDGDYTIEAWHEKLGVQTQQVSILSGKANPLSFSFSE